MRIIYRSCAWWCFRPFYKFARIINKTRGMVRFVYGDDPLRTGVASEDKMLTRRGDDHTFVPMQGYMLCLCDPSTDSEDPREYEYWFGKQHEVKAGDVYWIVE